MTSTRPSEQRSTVLIDRPFQLRFIRRLAAFFVFYLVLFLVISGVAPLLLRVAGWELSWGLSETGAAGPTGNRYGDPPGHTCIGVVGPGVERTVTVATGREDRGENMEAFAQAALDLLAACVQEAG